MRANKTKHIITLGRGGRSAWSTRTAGTPEAYAARNKVLGAAQELANTTGRTWEVYAPAEAGGYLMEQVAPR